MAVVGNHVSILVSSVISSNAKENAYFISVYFANTTLFCNSAIFTDNLLFTDTYKLYLSFYSNTTTCDA